MVRSRHVWPPVIARHEPCYEIVCPSCGIFAVPLFYVLTIRRCPACQRDAVDTRQHDHWHWWPMMVGASEKDDTSVEREMSDILGIDSRHKVRLYLFAPFSDEFSAVMWLSKHMGFLLPRASA